MREVLLEPKRQREPSIEEILKGGRVRILRHIEDPREAPKVRTFQTAVIRMDARYPEQLDTRKPPNFPGLIILVSKDPFTLHFRDRAIPNSEIATLPEIHVAALPRNTPHRIEHTAPIYASWTVPEQAHSVEFFLPVGFRNDRIMSHLSSGLDPVLVGASAARMETVISSREVAVMGQHGPGNQRLSALNSDFPSQTMGYFPNGTAIYISMGKTELEYARAGNKMHVTLAPGDAAIVPERVAHVVKPHDDTPTYAIVSGRGRHSIRERVHLPGDIETEFIHLQRGPHIESALGIDFNAERT